MTQTPGFTIKSITLTDKAVDNILVQADIRYWNWKGCDNVKRNDQGEWIGYTVYKEDAPEEFEVTKEGIEKAIVEVISGKHVNDYYREHIYKEFMDYMSQPEYGIGTDSDMNDIIVQIAAFGEVIYS